MNSAKALPVVAIVGRPNVGKSALFNRIVGRRISIVHEQSGVTRDRVTAKTSYRGHHFMLVDTGGLGVHLHGKKDVGVFDGLIRDQVADIVAEADAIVWVVDCQAGMTPQDEEVAAFLREAERPVIVAANKADNEKQALTADVEFTAAGFASIVPTSCTQNQGIEDLLKRITVVIPAVEHPGGVETDLKVAVVGRPNVGKSSLVNQLVGAERVIVSETAGTTRDAVDVPVVVRGEHGDVPITLIDTAGLRRRRQVDTVVDFFSMKRTERAIRRSDVVILMLDATNPATSQDRRIARLIVDAYKPCLMLANKWDLLTRQGGIRQRELIQLIRDRMPFMSHSPLSVVCATSGYRVNDILDRLTLLREQMQVMIPTSVLNQFLQDTMAHTPPSMVGNRRFKVFYGAMAGNPPPHFILFANNRKACPDHYLQFLENRIRDTFFAEAGLPIRLEVRERKQRVDAEKGSRSAAAGVQRQKMARAQARERHTSRRKGWRKRT